MIYSGFIQDHLNDRQRGLDHLNYYYFENKFNDDECNFIRDYCDNNLELNRAIVFSGGDLNNHEDYRKSNVGWLNYNDETSFIYERLGECVNESNNIWKFDLCGMNECIQFTRYEGNENGRYDQHIDLGGNCHYRKISIILQLCDDKEYEGGDFLVWNGKDPCHLPKNKGTVICFPSFLLHQVNPVTSGRRESLVCWVSGPPFR